MPDVSFVSEVWYWKDEGDDGGEKNGSIVDVFIDVSCVGVGVDVSGSD